MKKLFKFVCLLFISTFGLSFAQSSQDLGLELSQDSNFIELAGILENYNNIEKNPSEIKRIFDLKSVLNEDERGELVTAMGFNSVENAYDFDSRNFELVSIVNTNFGLDALSPQDLQETLIIAFGNLYEPEIEGNCKKRYNNCFTKATATYYGALSACVAAGVGIGAASFWCAGCLGAVVGAGCATAAVAYFSASADDCKLDYKECVD